MVHSLVTGVFRCLTVMTQVRHLYVPCLKYNNLFSILGAELYSLSALWKTHFSKKFSLATMSLQKQLFFTTLSISAEVIGKICGFVRSSWVGRM